MELKHGLPRCYMVVFGLVLTGLIATPSWATPLTIVADTADSGLFDSSNTDGNNDNNGDSTPGGSSSAYQVGEGATDSGEARIWLPFSLTPSERASIANAQSITLDISLAIIDNATGFNLDIHGIGSRTDVNPTASDFQAASTLLVDDAFTPTSDLGFASFDVTTFVRDQAALSSDTIIAFRLQMDPNTLPNTNGALDRYVIRLADRTDGNQPTLTVTPIPEPSSVALLSLGGLLCMGRRRWSS